jgi:hypothetical protein
MNTLRIDAGIGRTRRIVIAIDGDVTAALGGGIVTDVVRSALVGRTGIPIVTVRGVQAAIQLLRVLTVTGVEVTDFKCAGVAIVRAVRVLLAATGLNGVNTGLRAHVTGIDGTDITIVAECVCVGTVIRIGREDAGVGRCFADIECRWVGIITLIIRVAAIAHSRWVDDRKARVTYLGVRIAGVDRTHIHVVTVGVDDATVCDDVGAKSAFAADAAIEVARILIVALTVRVAAKRIYFGLQTLFDGWIADLEGAIIKVVAIDIVVAAAVCLGEDAIRIETAATFGTGVGAQRYNACGVGQAVVTGLVLTEGRAVVVPVSVGGVVHRIVMLTRRKPVRRIAIIGVGMEEFNGRCVLERHQVAVDGNRVHDDPIGIEQLDGVIHGRAGFEGIRERNGRSINVARDEPSVLRVVGAAR